MLFQTLDNDFNILKYELIYVDLILLEKSEGRGHFSALKHALIQSQSEATSLIILLIFFIHA